jgi:hypothetical protein
MGARLAPFVVACGDYLVDALDRLYRQDRGISDRLKARVPSTEKDVHEGLATLDVRQAAMRNAVEQFAAALEAFRNADGASVDSFLTAAHAFSDFLEARLLSRRNPYEVHTDRVFAPDDWIDIADATPGAIALELKLFAAVKALAPEGCDPDAFSGAHTA